MQDSKERVSKVRCAITAFVAMAVLAVTSFGCATVQPAPNPRKGFLESLGSVEVRKGGARLVRQSVSGARPHAAIERGPAMDPKWVRKIRTAVSNWKWPVKDVSVTSEYGPRGESYHEGIDLRAKTGTPVYAAQSGKVLYSASRIAGYGKMVVIRHRDGLSTVYAHNSRLLVKEGQVVKRGQRIALAGNTGASRGPHVHFEVRSGVVALDPLKFMPVRGVEKASEPARARSVASMSEPAKRAKKKIARD